MSSEKPSDKPEFPAYLRTQSERMAQNLSRVESLINLFDLLQGLANNFNFSSTEHTPPDAADVLRSAVVLLHASLEDFLRSIAMAHLPRTNADFLKTLPLAGKQRGEKYNVADLIQHRGKTIDEVLDDSINQWLNNHSFNHTDDVRGILNELKIPVDYFSSTYKGLEEMIARRHKIVHQADRTVDSADGVAALTRDVVEGWRENVEDFMSRVLYQLQSVVKS